MVDLEIRDELMVSRRIIFKDKQQGTECVKKRQWLKNRIINWFLPFLNLTGPD